MLFTTDLNTPDHSFTLSRGVVLIPLCFTPLNIYLNYFAMVDQLDTLPNAVLIRHACNLFYELRLVTWFTLYHTICRGYTQSKVLLNVHEIKETVLTPDDAYEKMK